MIQKWWHKTYIHFLYQAYLLLFYRITDHRGRISKWKSNSLDLRFLLQLLQKPQNKSCNEILLIQFASSSFIVVSLEVKITLVMNRKEQMCRTSSDFQWFVPDLIFSSEEQLLVESRSHFLMEEKREIAFNFSYSLSSSMIQSLNRFTLSFKILELKMIHNV